MMFDIYNNGAGRCLLLCYVDTSLFCFTIVNYNSNVCMLQISYVAVCLHKTKNTWHLHWRLSIKSANQWILITFQSNIVCTYLPTSSLVALLSAHQRNYQSTYEILWANQDWNLSREILAYSARFDIDFPNQYGVTFVFNYSVSIFSEEAGFKKSVKEELRCADVVFCSWRIIVIIIIVRIQKFKASITFFCAQHLTFYWKSNISNNKRSISNK